LAGGLRAQQDATLDITAQLREYVDRLRGAVLVIPVGKAELERIPVRGVRPAGWLVVRFTAAFAQGFQLDPAKNADKKLRVRYQVVAHEYVPARHAMESVVLKTVERTVVQRRQRARALARSP
jgi:hypothetical protein